MNGFFSSMAAEAGARRRRLRGSFGDRGQGLVEFLILTGLAAGSLGLFMGSWMARAAPWGFALPFVFVAGLFAIEWRRQRHIAQGGEAEGGSVRGDWAVLLLGFGCALAGAAAFVIAWGAKPLPAQPDWTPPPDAVISTMVTPP